MRRVSNSRSGLVLLVVLGMLALFTLLTVTYVVFASQSKSTNVALSRRFVHQTSEKPLFEEAIKQLIRGTNNTKSKLKGHDLLGDLYGANETSTLGAMQVRNNLTHFSTDLRRPMLLGGEFTSGTYRSGRFLKIPLQVDPSLMPLPLEEDLLTGRIVTFSEGPLKDQSFHIVRYIGDRGADPASYSITIDLAEADLGKSHSQFVNSGVQRELLTGTVWQWANRVPAVTNGTSGIWAAGVYLCYELVDLNGPTRVLNGGYKLFLNAVPLNGHGIGVGADGAGQLHALVPGAPANVLSPNINYVSSGLQADVDALQTPTFGQLVDPNLSTTNVDLLGDTDEPIDVPDFRDWHLSYNDGVENIPSFHRVALINHLVNFKPLAAYTEAEFWATLKRLEMAIFRPLSFNVRTPSAPPAFMGPTNGVSYLKNPEFQLGGISTLTIDIPNNWATNWPNIGVPAFRSWLSSLFNGPYDVDSLGKGTLDTVLMDIDLPLQRTSDGKLLKALVGYHVEDMDGKLDVNAVGSSAQSNLNASLSLELFGRPTDIFNGLPNSAYAYGRNVYLPQGDGYGPADTTIRHLFGKPPMAGYSLAWNGTSGPDAGEIAHREFFSTRLSPSASSASLNPGNENPGFDSLADLTLREARTARIHAHSSLPGLPYTGKGRLSTTLDRLGNPIFYNNTSTVEGGDSEYASRLITTPHQDTPFSLAELERIIRNGDSDSATLPDRLQKALGETIYTLPSSSLRSEITTRSRSLRVPQFGFGTSLYKNNSGTFVPPPKSFYDLVKSILVRKQFNVANFDMTAFNSLFPIEFQRGRRMDLNRLFGNGEDDDNDGEVDEPSEYYFSSAYQETSVSNVGPSAAPLQPFGNLDESMLGLDPQVKYPLYDPMNFPLNTRPEMLGEQTRQWYARHLYSLAQLLVPEEHFFPNVDRTYWASLLTQAKNGSLPPLDQQKAWKKIFEIRARILAQWAVNAVDFRDVDSVMTRFPYDPDPFDRLTLKFNANSWAPGWDLQRWKTDSNSNFQFAVVWGLEQPELLITESLAFHDVRVRQDKAKTMPKVFSQFRIPQGSLFLEFYCPRTTEAVSSTRLPGASDSLYKADANSNFALDLSRWSPSLPGSSVKYPVWRVYISNPRDKSTASPPTHKTPNNRLLNQPSSLTETQFDLTYQLPVSNTTSGTLPAGTHPSGLVYDHTGLTRDSRLSTIPDDPTNRVPEPDLNESRVILFVRNFDPTDANTPTPGVANAAAQVYYNRETTDITLRGNQYLTVGPRLSTILGSRVAADASPPTNIPSKAGIDLGSAAAPTLTADDGTNTAVGFRSSQNIGTSISMIAGANAPTGWTYSTFIGINVSEPRPNQYYKAPTTKVNTLASGGFPVADGYFDYSAGNPPNPETPFDNGVKEPLKHWDLNDDGLLDTVSAEGDGSSPVVKPGTELDWCTAYLQRLADPNKPWDVALNPYITVDWMPIDLSVFSGEDNKTDLKPSATFRLASRQKAGQTIDPTTMRFSTSATGGSTFYSSLTHAPRIASKDPSGSTFLEYFIEGDRYNTSLNQWSPRPSKSDSSFIANDAMDASFTTLGFLNSPFVLASESSVAITALDPIYVGAPGDPVKASATWRPESLFWTNRPFINQFELSYVPVSSAGQLGQEFSATASASENYGGSSRVNNDPRIGSSFSSPGVSAMEVPDSDLPQIQFSQTNPDGLFVGSPRGPFPSSTNTRANYPYSYLLNFFQEAPDLTTPYQASSGGYEPYRTIYPKDTGLVSLLELTETPSPWGDVQNFQSPEIFAAKTTGDPDLASVVSVSNDLLSVFRAPNNAMFRDVEPGKVNLNTMQRQNVYQGLVGALLKPGDIDFFPYESDPAHPFSESNDIDHNEDDIRDHVDTRIEPYSTNALWKDFVESRQGFVVQTSDYTGPGLFPPANAVARGLHPSYPTQFAGAFKPITEAGMVPRTRSPLDPASIPAMPSKSDADWYAKNRQFGVLDSGNVNTGTSPSTFYNDVRSNPTQAGILRSKLASNKRLFEYPSFTPSQKYPYEDLYPISRLQKLVSDRSNVFSVYATVALFEYDPQTGDIGKEYGVDSGEARRFKAFYIIDRSIPVGYRVGEDHNIENTILVRRILSE